MKPEQLELLYLSFDAELTAEQTKELDLALSESDELRAEKLRLSELRATLASCAGEFNPFFETRVLERIKAERPEFELSRTVESLGMMFRRIALAGALGALVLAAINLTDSDELSVGAIFAVQDNASEAIWLTPYEEAME